MATISQKEPLNYGLPWIRSELILAFDLYCRIPFRLTKANNPEVIDLAKILKRSPASVARKLGNFGSFDPELQKKDVSGLLHASKLDKEIWDEFQSDWNKLVWEAANLRNDLVGQENDFAGDENIIFPQGASEKEIVSKTRVHQAFFRSAVLSSYEETCCITGLAIRECLVASHIVPWSESEQSRTDPRNGLCLSATFDKLFDRGLIALTDELQVLVSSRLLKTKNKRTEEMVCRYHNAPLMRPKRFLPRFDYVEWHRANIFQR